MWSRFYLRCHDSPSRVVSQLEAKLTEDFGLIVDICCAQYACDVGQLLDGGLISASVVRGSVLLAVLPAALLCVACRRAFSVSVSAIQLATVVGLAPASRAARYWLSLRRSARRSPRVWCLCRGHGVEVETDSILAALAPTRPLRQALEVLWGSLPANVETPAIREALHAIDNTSARPN
jgi:hypothetical protein